MEDAQREISPPDSEPPQPLVGFMTNAEWEELLGHVNGLVGDMERLPFPEVREKVFALLAGIDTLHREALRRLVRLFKEGVLEKVVTDPAIRTLMELYDLLPPGAEAAGVEAPEHGKSSRLSGIPIKVVGAAAPPAPSRPAYPHWVPVLLGGDELAPGSVVACDTGERSVLLCRVKDKFFALDARCLEDGSSLAAARLDAYMLACPNHPGCLYDVRQGAHIARGGQLECFPVKQEAEGRILVGLDMPFAPDLPTF